MKEEMKEQIVEEIGKDIKEKNTMSKEYEGKVNKRIFSNILLAVGILIYLTLVILGSRNIESSVFIVDLKVLSIILSLLSIIIFEKSYKSANGKLCIYGIEFLILAIMTLVGAYVFQIINRLFIPVICIVAIAYAVYYLVKSIGIYTKSKKEYVKSQSDMNEIVKDELPETAETKRRRNILEEQLEQYNNLKEDQTTPRPNRVIKTQTLKTNSFEDEEEENIEEKVEEKKKPKKASSTSTKKTSTKKSTTKVSKENISKEETPKKKTTAKTTKTSKESTKKESESKQPKKATTTKKTTKSETNKTKTEAKGETKKTASKTAKTTAKKASTTKK